MPFLSHKANSVCSYGTDDQANRSLLEYYCYHLILTISMCLILIFNQNLHKFYKPLARIVDISLILKILSSSLYFAYYPYHEGQGNCTEIFVGRLAKCFIMLGEMHQVYLLIHVLGLSKYKFLSLPSSISLETYLNIMSSIVITTILLTYNYFQSVVRPIRHMWSMCVALLQVYIIHLARMTQSINKEHDVISHNDTSILMIEKLSILQFFHVIPIRSSSIISMWGGNITTNKLGRDCVNPRRCLCDILLFESFAGVCESKRISRLCGRIIMNDNMIYNELIERCVNEI